MKIEQLTQLDTSISKEQLKELAGAKEANIEEYLRIQKWFEDNVKHIILKEKRINFTRLMYKLFTNNYAHIANHIMDKLLGCTQWDIFSDVYAIVETIVDDIEGNIIYTDEFIDNLVDCYIEYGKGFFELFEIYVNALDDEILKEAIIKIISNKSFVIHRAGSYQTFISKLKKVAALDGQNKGEPLSKNVEAIIKIILSEDLLYHKSNEEHENIVRFFIYSFDKENSYNLLDLITSKNVITRRHIDEHLYLIYQYNELIHDEKENSTINRLFRDDKVYTELTFDFQMYLISICRSIKDEKFFSKLNKLLDFVEKNLELEIKRLIKEYTDYASTVEMIINDSGDAVSATNIIVTEAKSENIEDISLNTKLVLVPEHKIGDTIENLKKRIKRK